MNESLLAYIPMDRRRAMAQGLTLPDRTSGSALFADVSGFTPLTEALVNELGPQRGAEELTGYLNEVYDALIEELHHWGGSAIAFAGDAVTCWFDSDDGQRGAACALAMQEAMQAFSAVQTPAGSTVELSMKAAVAVGPARRFLVGDPKSRVIDTVAGATLERLAAAEHEATRGEVILAPCAVAALGDQVEIKETRVAEDGRRFCVVSALLSLPQPPQFSVPDAASFNEDDVSTWLLKPVYRRLNRGLGEFLAEIRPTVAVFMRFCGIDYDDDEAAGEKLDETIRAVQSIVDRYEGTLMDLNIGDKGSYLYVNFGAPLSHENNAARAASAALELRALPVRLGYLDPVQIGISRGRMRAGAYGGAGHRTYGVLGDAVNLSARLMLASDPGAILVSMNVQEEIADLFDWDILAPIRVKGKSEPVPVALLKALKPRTGMHLPDMDEEEPLVGRDRETGLMREAMERAFVGKGQVFGLVGEAGLGKSRLISAALNMARERGFAIYGGEAESHGINSSYLVWHPIWSGMFGLDPTWNLEAQTEVLRRKLGELDAGMVQRLPLLGPAVQLAIPDNDLTKDFDAKLRKSLLETMLVSYLTAAAANSPLVLILEDCHWLDALSMDLLEKVAGAIDELPVWIILSYRATGDERIRRSTIFELPYFSAVELSPLTEHDLASLAEHRLKRLPDYGRDDAATAALALRIARQADGNPFYLEELVNFVGSQAEGAQDPNEITDLALPTSLHSLVLSRLDQLHERPKTVLKVASVVGRVFHASWLEGIYPELGARADIRQDLDELSRRKFTVFDPGDGDDTYYFRNVITRGVIYDSLLHKSRTTLHEQTGQFLETAYAGDTDQYLDLLAYHYEHGQSEDKKRYYLRRAGEFAQRSYANQAAIDYFRKVAPLLPAAEQIEIKLKLGEVEKLVGNWDEARRYFQEALSLARSTGDQSAVGWSQIAIGDMQRMQGNYANALTWLERARLAFKRTDNQEGLAQVLHISGTVAAQQGDLEHAEDLYQESLAVRREIGDQVGVSSLLSNLAIIAEYRGDYDGSRQLNEEALAIRREGGDRRNITNSLSNLGNVLMLLGDYAAARNRLEEAVAINREIGEIWLLATTLNNLGNVVRAQGNYAEAGVLYTEALDIMERLGDGWATAYLLEDVARLSHLEGLNSDALILLSAADALREKIDSPLPPTELEALKELQVEIQVLLGTTFVGECQEAGRQLSQIQAIDYARKTIGARI